MQPQRQYELAEVLQEIEKWIENPKTEIMFPARKRWSASIFSFNV